MTAQQENRSGRDRRKSDHFSKASGMHDRRWNKDPRSSVIDEDDVYDPDWDISDAELEAFARLSLDD